jgi:hypothetical protein
MHFSGELKACFHDRKRSHPSPRRQLHRFFRPIPQRYRHRKLTLDDEAARLTMDVDENSGLFEGHQPKLNSYDLGVDIELAV